jgi:hypothetical protein
MSPVFFLSSSPLAVQLLVLSFGGCSACSGRYRRHSHGRAAARVVLPKPLHVCVSYLYDCHSLSSSESRAEGRYEKEYFCVEKCVSLWPAAREAARQTATQQSPVPTHRAIIHHCPPPTSTSLLPSILSFLIRSSHPRRLLSARSHSSRPATSTGALLTVVSSRQHHIERRPSLLANPTRHGSLRHMPGQHHRPSLHQHAA